MNKSPKTSKTKDIYKTQCCTDLRIKLNRSQDNYINNQNNFFFFFIFYNVEQ